MQYETNSKLIKKGDIFVAIKGCHYDGHNFINEAINNGAIKIIGEENFKGNVKYKKVKSSKKYLTKILGKQNSMLTKKMKIIGITGTKGKTTTSMIIYQLLKSLNVPVAYIGTLGLLYKDEHIILENTTPDIITLNKIFKTLNSENIDNVVMEVSSHALCEKRTKGIAFDNSVFTNFSQDHLDYHKTMKNYLNAKLKIIIKTINNIVVNSDDISFASIKKKTKRYISVGKNADFKLIDYKLFQTHSIVTFEYHYDTYTVSIPLVGKHNIYNYLEAIATLIDMGYEMSNLINASNSLKPIPGRNELISLPKGYVIIDYAHSPASVKETLLTYNELKKGRIITIIGCGGNRDKTKRPIMGKIAVENSDYVIFTSDNPRDEDPNMILKDITKDLTQKNYEIISDRKKAIKKGVKLLKKNDYLLILGKGHEDYQIINNVKYHLSDKEEVLKYLS